MKVILTVVLASFLLVTGASFADNGKIYPKCDPDTPHNCE